MKLEKFFYKKVNSTNDVAIKKIKKGHVAGIIVSKEQNKGRGQHGKKWISIKGNLFLTIFFKIKQNKSLKKITSFNCTIIRKILSKIFKVKISIKLPNDLLINKKKFCGILQETIFFNKNKFLIVGIGINLLKNPNIYEYPATNLLKEKGFKFSKTEIVNRIKKGYEINLKKFTLND